MNIAIIVAAGSGNRMESDIRKQYLLLGHHPILWHSLKVFESCPEIDQIYLCIPKQDFDFCRSTLLSHLESPERIRLVPGGARRQESVYNGIMAINTDAGPNDIVVIHDGVRPFIHSVDITGCIRGAVMAGACIIGIPATDTLKRVDDKGHVAKTLSRENVWMAQTPQAFRYHVIKTAHEAGASKKRDRNRRCPTGGIGRSGSSDDQGAGTKYQDNDPAGSCACPCPASHHRQLSY